MITVITLVGWIFLLSAGLFGLAALWFRGVNMVLGWAGNLASRHFRRWWLLALCAVWRQMRTGPELTPQLRDSRWVLALLIRRHIARDVSIAQSAASDFAPEAYGQHAAEIRLEGLVSALMAARKEPSDGPSYTLEDVEAQLSLGIDYLARGQEEGRRYLRE